MKKMISLLLVLAMLMTMISGCAKPKELTTKELTPVIAEDEPELDTEQTEVMKEEDTVPHSELIGSEQDQKFGALEDEIYAELVDTLDPEQYYVQDISTSYVSKEYLEEIQYNSQKNIFFGYSLSELDAAFEGSRYIFTLDEDGKTTVEELTEVTREEYDELLKAVAIGTGIILIQVSVAVLTKSPSAAVNSGKVLRILYCVSSAGAKGAAIGALQFAGLGGLSAAAMEAMQHGNGEDILQEGLKGACEGFKLGAILGTVRGTASGFYDANHNFFFKKGTPQAKKYPNGIQLTQTSDGKVYPRFEKYAKATAKFDVPTLDAASNHSGLSGNYYWDSKLANAQCGFTSTPKGYVWHHVEDMQTMILVPRDVHSACFGGMPHTGGASLIKQFLGLP